VDEPQIAQVVDNLLINARQAMPAGGTVWVQLGNAPTGPSPGAGPCVHLSVQDEGPGIPRELWTRVFDPFFTTKAGGTGLGLAMVYSIVRRHGGHVEVGAARAGRGARLDVYLPAAPGAQRAPRARVTESLAVEEGRSGRILVMDDEDHVRNVAQAALARMGYVVLLARDDQEAVVIAERQRAGGETIDAAILDLTIPGGAGGVEALRRLRTIIPGLAAIASSGYSADAIMARPGDFGFDAALPKPYTLAEIRAVVTETIARRARL
jgi:CheY-like chemotaxis protein